MATPKDKKSAAEEEVLKAAADASKAASEEAELQRMVEEEEAKAELEAVKKLAAKAPPPVIRVATGDVSVRCLSDIPYVNMGGRVYCLKKGQNIKMEEGHATALNEKGHVIPLKE